MPEIGTILILSSSGGGGLIQAANAKEQQLRAKYPNARILRKDVLRDWGGKWGGGHCAISLWNSAQKSGSVRILKFLCIGIAISDICFAPHVFFHLLRLIFREEIDLIVDTQPLCTGWILKALRLFHWKTGKKIGFEKVVVDLPTPKATHYFRSIRKLSEKERPYLKVTTITPLLQIGETPAQFWEKHCRLSETQIQYEPFYVRQSFLRYHKKPRLAEPFLIKAAIHNEDEGACIRKAVEKGRIQASWQATELELTVQPQDFVAAILLGSQPAYEASLNYVRQFLALAREYQGAASPCHLFVFCAHHHLRERSLLHKVSDIVCQTENYPSCLSVIPLSFQTDAVVAPIFYRSDVTCTRSGGQTLMELMCVAPKQIWIHSESKRKDQASQEELLKEGIAGWEAANALYMQRIYGAKIVTPYSFIPYVRAVWQSGLTNHS